MKSRFLVARNACFSYSKNLPVLLNVSFEMEQFEKIMLLGSADSGKTTFLKVLSGFEKASGGEVMLRGTRLDDIPDNQKNFSLLLSDPALINTSVMKNLNFLWRALGKTAGDEKFPILTKENYSDFYEKNSELFVKYNLEKIQLLSNAKDLSLSVKRKFSLLRSEFKHPDILFLDNFFEKLDSSEQEEMKKIYRGLISDQTKTIIFAIDEKTFSEDKEFFRQLPVGKILYLVDGNVFLFDSIDKFNSKIINVDQLGFIGHYSIFAGSVDLSDGGSGITIPGRTFEPDGVFCKSCLSLGSLHDDILLAAPQDIDILNCSESELFELINKTVFIFSAVGGERLL